MGDSSFFKKIYLKLLLDFNNYLNQAKLLERGNVISNFILMTLIDQDKGTIQINLIRPNHLVNFNQQKQA